MQGANKDIIEYFLSHTAEDKDNFKAKMQKLLNQSPLYIEKYFINEKDFSVRELDILCEHFKINIDDIFAYLDKKENKI
ncbi:hypothetical protein ABSA28_00560 [Candidatus Hepatincolaceae symbiont of Richtersius coronifer]